MPESPALLKIPVLLTLLTRSMASPVVCHLVSIPQRVPHQ
uniref:Uncharacterized protein n=1 Tax=Anguilla anguilla TaxID=7936 RepID=A0A0E9PP16_ANGAN